jgi:enoyl-CoA hydratase/carnithine racemase
VTAIRLDRPAKRNAIDQRLVTALLEAVAGAGDDVLVLGSTDPGVFCAGADLSVGDAERVAVSDLLYELYERLVTRSAPVVAAIGGPAVGGGAQLALAADLRVATPTASLRFAGPGHGLAVGAWGLPGVVGRGRAMDLCLTMRPVRAPEALAIGLVDRVDADADALALALAASLATLDAGAAGRVREVGHAASGTLDALRRERAGNREAWSGSVDGLAGSAAAPAQEGRA